jgi:two-component system NtrC family sensor kinase
MPETERESIRTESARVLVVDDDRKMGDYIADLLHYAHYTPFVCRGGEEALQYIAGNAVDIVLLDVLMPGINGIMAAKKMKEIFGKDRFVPIILITALASDKDKIAGLQYADDYLTKPFSGEELVARIESLLRIQRLQKELVRSKQRYQSLYENFPHMYVSLDPERRITDVNRLFCQVYDIEKTDIIGQRIHTIFSPAEHAALDTFLNGLDVHTVNTHQAFTLVPCFALTEERTVMLSAIVMDQNQPGLSVVITMQDITQQIKMENERHIARMQLYRSARLASIGRLASGIAHEVNNPLTAILGFSSALLQRVSAKEGIDYSELDEYLSIINSETIRCRDIIENLLKFARESDTVCTSVLLNDCVKTAIKLIHARAKKSNVSIHNQLDTQLYVCTDSQKLVQVLLHIITNSIDFAQEPIAVRLAAEKGTRREGFVSLRVSDTGPGIDAGVLPKVFDPFFTTKDVGQGVGLGLAICHKTMEECNGYIDIVSAAGRGTEVIIDIPDAEYEPGV